MISQESVGSCGTGQMPEDRDWIVHCQKLCISYIRFILGDPPHGSKLLLIWHEHELGEYPTIGVQWDSEQYDAPWSYINKCEALVTAFDNAVSWSEIEPDAALDEALDSDDDDEDSNEEGHSES